jgi:CDK-activating kinase assembly factor MAT1
MEAVCPRCKTTSYRNPNMKLMVNVCGHNLCESCVELLFVKGSGTCPECNVPLRRTNFRLQLFEDAIMDKEVDIRRRILRDFNKQPEDFGCLKDYNDYLEMVEDIIYNLSNNIDIIDTNKTIQTYKDTNKEQILRGRIKPSKESLELEDLLLEERRIKAKVSKEQQILEDAEKAARIRNKEKLIDDLMFGEEDADKILEQHREEVLQQEKKRIVFSTGQDTIRPAVPVNLPEDKPFVYEPLLQEFLGPSPPTEQMLKSEGFTQNIRAANQTERAGGYVENIGCLRAVQEAMAGLYFQPVVEP